MPKYDKTPKYYIDKNNSFVIENYNFAKPFSSFFPGIAGKYGIPMWTFYVNRGQCISSFGIKNKDHAILEFYPANKAWQLVSSHGFRTFIKIKNHGGYEFYEPFQNGFTNLKFDIRNKMLISYSGLLIEEENLSLKIKVSVRYFNIPNSPFAGLARIVTVTNLGAKKRNFELLDGLPQIIPFGTNNFFLKEMSRTIEAWMSVENLDKNVPYFKLATDPSDRPEVVHIREGNFYLGFNFNANNKVKIIKPIINPCSIFGTATDFSCPRNFIGESFSAPKKETLDSKTPCSFIFDKFKLNPKEERMVYSVSGYMRAIKDLNASVNKITLPGYLNKMETENCNLVKGLLGDVLTESALKEFNLYVGQTYLDNFLRGGYPFTFPKSLTSFYLYSRKHGDPERDYNKFQIAPTYFSQGNGNYRDLNQNRRNDIWFNPQIKEENIVSLINLIQLDGFNPLIVKGVLFSINNIPDIKLKISGFCNDKDIESMLGFLKGKHFSPGDLVHFIEDQGIKLKVSYDELLDALLPLCVKSYEAEHGEGFWIDHWHYNLDLLESYLKVYPENYKKLVFEDSSFTFYDNTHSVRPRNEKYQLYNGLPRQLHAVYQNQDKKELIHKRKNTPHIVRKEYGHGEIYHTTLINKLFCLLLNKFASLDPFGVGIEMESDKPNWFDSLNGLPALFGSSLCETLELKRLAIFIKESISLCAVKEVCLAEEFNQLINSLSELTKDYFDNKESSDFQWWDRAHVLKEEFRKKTEFGISGKEITVSCTELLNSIDIILRKIDLGIDRAWDKENKLYHGYFIHEVINFEKIKDNFIKPLSFRQVPLPLFLEPQVHAMRITKDSKKAKELYCSVKKSGLYDKKLGMYKVTAPLKSMPEEIGRCRVFPPGWLENESVWLHMEYKFILELLKNRLYEEFFTDFRRVLVPFQNPKVYGRSTLENSSFIVSSAFRDSSLHGNGFVARLSGSTAELLDIWLRINLGEEPFFVGKDGGLSLRFKPVLPGWLFDNKGSYRFNLLSRISVTYYNPKRKDTFGMNAPRIKKIEFNDEKGRKTLVNSDTLPSPYAQQVRSGKINKIDIYLD